MPCGTDFFFAYKNNLIAFGRVHKNLRILGDVLLLARRDRTPFAELDVAGAQLAGGGAEIVGSVLVEF